MSIHQYKRNYSELHVPCMTKSLRKAVIKRSEVKNKYVHEKLKSYKKQRNFCC